MATEVAVSTCTDYKDLLDESSRNKTSVKCDRCGSLMLRPANADFADVEYDLPEARQKRPTAQAAAEETAESEGFTCQKLKHFWMVKDMYTFENIGFSNTVNNKKYLICADCEVGPVGYYDLDTKQCYIALDRVKHE
ncbi:guanine nucleotide exchange factor MSS4 homolog [Anopheles darlingi]|uniref:guanine nucleotide exchange factor MSS4 homolog n=1 Tax=Anopheles darlingi TaxID=43151 RepID=UPI0021004045|nr:guanine nucleotide exchange factor MSS4 homolog [Anopheles darlingi]